MSDREKVLESEPEKVVPSVTFDKVVFVRIITPGILLQEPWITVDVSIVFFEVPNGHDRVKKQPFTPGHL